MIKYKVEVWMNKTDSILLHDVLFIAFVADIFRVTRRFDEPVWNMSEIHKIEVELQRS